jgi:hypothetical protein
MLLLRAFPSIVLVATGSVTLANSRISAVANTAFVDFSVANVLTDYVTGHHYLILYDSTMKSLTGYIKAAGTGETYSSTLIPNGVDFTGGPPPTGWGEHAGGLLTSVEGGDAGNCLQVANSAAQQGYGTVDTASNTTVGALYEFSFKFKKGTSAHGQLQVVSAYAKTWDNLTDANWTQYTQVFTASTTYLNIYVVNGDAVIGATSLWDTFVERQVLTPSATGVTIVSTIGGTTQSWTSQTSGFNYYDGSGYTYQIFRVRR